MRNVNPFGLLIVAVGVAASYCISIYQGLQLSPVAWIAGIYALIGAAAVTWEMIGWHRSAHLLREKRHLAFAMNALGLFLASCVTVLLFELAFLATALEGMASRNAVAVLNRGSLEIELSQLQAGITKGGATRGAAAVRAQIEADKAGRMWALTSGCAAEATTTRDRKAFCDRYTAAVAELGQAEATESAQMRIREISGQLTPLGQVGAADARALYISRLIGSSEQGARVIVGFLVILFLYFSRAIGGFVFFDPSPKAKEARTEPEENSGDGGSRKTRIEAPAHNIARLRLIETAEHAEAVERITHDAPSDEAIALADLERALVEMSAPDTSGRTEQRVSMADAIAERVAGDGKMDVEKLIRRFCAECLVADQASREGASHLHKAFRVWCDDLELPCPDDHSVFGVVMTRLIAEPPYCGKKAKSSGWWYVGVRLKPVISHRVAVAHAKMPALGPMTPRHNGLPVPVPAP